jgi:hypothetical protein
MNGQEWEATSFSRNESIEYYVGSIYLQGPNVVPWGSGWMNLATGHDREKEDQLEIAGLVT